MTNGGLVFYSFYLLVKKKRIVIISSLQKKTTPAKRKIKGSNSLVAVKPRGVVSDAYKHTLCSFPPLLAVGTRPAVHPS